MNEPTHVDLFSGIGGFALAAKWAGFRTIAFCEIDKYCQKIIAKNFKAIHRNAHINGKPTLSVNDEASELPRIVSNIFDFDGTLYRGSYLITGGFPCQPFSVAGKRRGAADDRAIWPQMFRVISEARPAWVLGENVPGIIPMELDNVLSDLEGIGYACRPFVIPACAVDSRHRRDRLWIIGTNISDSERDGLSRSEERRSFVEATAEKSSWAQHALYAAGTGCIPTSEGDVSYPPGGRCEQCDTESETPTGIIRPSVSDTHSTSRSPGRNDCGMGRQRQSIENVRDYDACRWLPEPDVGRVAHGIPNRVDRLKGLGNAIVPQVAYEILKEIRKMIP